jgi:hypothetical protein
MHYLQIIAIDKQIGDAGQKWGDIYRNLLGIRGL